MLHYVPLQHACYGHITHHCDALQTNDALVAPLLRLKDNNCHVEESERVLKKKEKFSELIILYERKGLHQKGEVQFSRGVQREALLFFLEGGGVNFVI